MSRMPKEKELQHSLVAAAANSWFQVQRNPSDSQAMSTSPLQSPSETMTTLVLRDVPT